MKWNVLFTPKARRDTNGIYTYFEKERDLHDFAGKQYKKIVSAAESLAEFPRRYPIYKEKNYVGFDLRMIPAGKAVLFYVVLDEINVVYIVRVMHVKQNIDSLLNELDLKELLRDESL